MTLELYKMDSCPFCRRVMRYLEESGRSDVKLVDINTEPGANERLIRDGGLDQVPCLFIDGEPLYESADIIAWLKDNPQKSNFN